MGRWSSRLAVLLAVAAAAAGGTYAVRLATPDPGVPAARAETAPASPLAPTRVTYTVSRTAVTGRAGASVRAVIVRLTRRGTVWATLAQGRFAARLPHGRRPTRLVVVLAGGTRRTIAVHRQ